MSFRSGLPVINDQNIVEVTRLREEIVGLKRQLVRKDQQLIEKDKQVRGSVLVWVSCLRGAKDDMGR